MNTEKLLSLGLLAIAITVLVGLPALHIPLPSEVITLIGALAGYALHQLGINTGTVALNNAKSALNNVTPPVPPVPRVGSQDNP